MKKPNYIVHADKLYEEVVHPLYTTYKPFDLPVMKPTPKWTGPKIPFGLWQEMAAWCQITQAKHKSEALVFLFLDLEKSEWKAWYLPQITNGMTVQADEDHKDYTTQRKAFPDLQFGSLHHHCTAGAFASGVDKADEKNREGLHFTLGNIGSAKHSVHYRFCIEGACYEGEAHEVIEYAKEIAQVPDKYRDSIHKEMILEPVEGWVEKDFEEELKNISKPVYNKPSVQSYGGLGQGFPHAHFVAGAQRSFWPTEEEDDELRESVEEILTFIDTDVSLGIDLGDLLGEIGYTSHYALEDDLKKVMNILQNSPKSKPAREKRETLEREVVYALTGVPLPDQTSDHCNMTKEAIDQWLKEYTNE